MTPSIWEQDCWTTGPFLERANHFVSASSAAMWVPRIQNVWLLNTSECEGGGFWVDDGRLKRASPHGSAIGMRAGVRNPLKNFASNTVLLSCSRVQFLGVHHQEETNSTCFSDTSPVRSISSTYLFHTLAQHSFTATIAILVRWWRAFASRCHVC